MRTRNGIDSMEKRFCGRRTRRWILLKKSENLLKNTGNHIGLPLRDPLL